MTPANPIAAFLVAVTLPCGDSFPVEIQVHPIGGPHHFIGGQVQVHGPDSLALVGPGWTVSYKRTAHHPAPH